ncbi:YbhB/YbcL family Raf kinase inhibitor-like protein [Parasphingorhabdus sp.]|uniref:YbhB/YbcL family Raf kinase inhibitor-like protein n=1 Tax=Parasphingorhabdus sp. TaxID=2709688 RepID=UPI003C756CE9
MIRAMALPFAVMLLAGCGYDSTGSAAPTPEATAQDGFVLTSPALTDDGMLPADLKCTRDGGDGLTPPLEWTQVPAGTESLSIIMHHYPRDTVEGKDPPSQYWLLWNIPVQTWALPRGNPASIGDEGADKDEKRTGYTSPCSPPGSRHEYIITLYALDGPLDKLPAHDDGNVDWATMTSAMEGKIIAASSLSFHN